MSAIDDPRASLLPDEAAEHAGVAVLCNRALWDNVLAFMHGYPFPIHVFLQQNDPTSLFGQSSVGALPCISWATWRVRAC